MQELKARIRAVLRRRGISPSGEGPALQFDEGQLNIDPVSQKVTVRGEPVDLTPTEYRLLLCLAYNAGRVLTADQILDNVWGPGYEDSPTNVKVYVRRLRQKLEEDAREPRYIQTVYGVGYRFMFFNIGIMPNIYYQATTDGEQTWAIGARLQY